MFARLGAMARYKHLIGPKLHVRSLPSQKSDVTIAVAVMSEVIQSAELVAIRVA